MIGTPTTTKGLKQLVPGDRVLHVGDGSDRPLTVTRVQPNTITCGVRRFDREDGRALGAPGWIVTATDAEVAAAEEEAKKPRATAKPKSDPALELARQIVATPAEDLAKLGEKRLRQIVGWLE